MEQHIRLMDIDLEHLTAYEYLCANYAADLRRFYREGLVSTLGCDFKCLDPALLAFDAHPFDVLQVAADPVSQHPLKIRLIHTLKGHFSAPYYKNILFVHLISCLIF